MGKKLDRIAFFDGIVFADSAGERVPPKEFMLVKYGKNTYTKDGKRGEFDFKPDENESMATFIQRTFGKDVVTRFREVFIDKKTEKTEKTEKTV